MSVKGGAWVEGRAYFPLRYIYEEEDTCLTRRRIHVLGARDVRGAYYVLQYIYIYIYISRVKRSTSKINEEVEGPFTKNIFCALQ